jgi:hypothetical protein
MKRYEYKNGSYYWMDGDKILEMSSEVGILFDVVDDTWVLLRHGDSERVRKFAEGVRRKYISSGLQDFADGLFVISGKFPIDELNHLIHCSGYGRAFYEKVVVGNTEGRGGGGV